jgi:transcriptional regulator with XRE-family HTH domain
VKTKTHPVCALMRELRQASGLSLLQAEVRLGISAIVLGSYERGDRIPPITKVEQVLAGYGYTLSAVPVDEHAVRLPDDMASELRLIADQLEKNNDLPRLP